MNQKGSVVIAALLILIAVTITVAGVWHYKGRKNLTITPDHLSKPSIYAINPTPTQTEILQEQSSKQVITEIATTSALHNSKNPINIQSDFVARITLHMWQHVQTLNTLYDGYEYQFFQNGTVRWNAISDYTEERNGRWSYKQLSKDGGLLYVQWNNIDKGYEDVLYFQFVDDKLQLAGQVLKPEKISPDVHSVMTRDVPDIYNEENFPQYAQITAHFWKRTNEENNSFVPDYYSFRRDGTFTARYRNGECQHNGHWSLEKGTFVLEMPAQYCDLRGYNNPVIQVSYYRLENGSLVLGEDTYIHGDK